MEFNTRLSKNTILTSSTDANNNILVVGSSGSGKYYSFIRPNIELSDTNYVVIDFKEQIYKGHAESLKKKGYNVTLIDSDFCGYNPFQYVHPDHFEADITNIADILVPMTKDTSFFDAECRDILKHFMLCAYLEHQEKTTFKLVTELVYSIITSANTQEAYNMLLSKWKLDLPSVKNLGFILSVIAFRLKTFPCYDVNEDSLDLHSFVTEKKALFITDPYTEMTQLLLWQIPTVIMRDVENNRENNNKYVTRFFLDEFPNLGFTPQIASVPGSYVNYIVFCQNLSQLQMLYDTKNDVLDMFDTILHLGRFFSSEMLLFKRIWLKNQRFSFQSPVKKLRNVSASECVIFTKGAKPKIDEKIVGDVN